MSGPVQQPDLTDARSGLRTLAVRLASGVTVLAACLGLAATQVGALTPLPPCEGEEGGMVIGYLTSLDDMVVSGVVIESFRYTVRLEGTVYQPQPGPVAALNGFSGSRVTHCPTGRILAVPGVGASELSVALAATEFLRTKVKAGRPVSFAEVQRAARALYGTVISLRETEQTCGCAAYYPDVLPKGMTPYAERGT